MQLSDTLHAFMWESMTANNCNTYLIDGPTRILIDPGHVRLFDHVSDGLDDLGLTLSDIGVVICTHAHPDHIEAVQRFKDTPARFAVHETEWRWITAMSGQIKASWGLNPEDFMPDFFLTEGGLTIDGQTFQVFHTPGHSPGSVCIYWPDHKALFTGDLVFAGGLGRTDLPGGNGGLLKESIRRMAELDTDTVLCGHGEIVSGADRVRKNFEEIRDYWFAYI